MVLEKTLESPLDCKEIQPVHSKGDQSWVFIGRTDAEAETPILWPPDVKSWLIGKDSDAGKDWGQEEKGMTEDWDGWMVSPTRWTWVGVNSGRWWWTRRPGMLRFMGSKGVGHNRATELNWTLYLGPLVKNLPANARDLGVWSLWGGGGGKIPWRRKWQPTPVVLPVKFQGQRSLTGYSPCDRKVCCLWAGTYFVLSPELLVKNT